MKTIYCKYIAAFVLLLSPPSLYARQQDEETHKDASGNTPDTPADTAPASPATGGFGGGMVGEKSFGDVRQISSNGVMITWSEKNDELRGFSTKLGDWEVISIEPQERIIPIVGDTVAAVRIGDSIAAFSGEKAWWDVIELSKDSKAVPVLYHSHVRIEDNGHLYTFAAEKGRWTSPTDPELQPLVERVSTTSNAEIEMLSEWPFQHWIESLPRYKGAGNTSSVHCRICDHPSRTQTLAGRGQESN